MVNTPGEHPLEALYLARDAMERAARGTNELRSAEVCDELASYGSANTAILYEFHRLLGIILGHVRANSDSSRELQIAAEELQDVHEQVYQLSALVTSHKTTIDALRRMNTR